jgi:hypothetical protein
VAWRLQVRRDALQRKRFRGNDRTRSDLYI